MKKDIFGSEGQLLYTYRELFLICFQVYKAQLFSNTHGIGLAIITTSNRMFLINNVSERKLRSAPDIPSKSYHITGIKDMFSRFLLKLPESNYCFTDF